MKDKIYYLDVSSICGRTPYGRTVKDGGTQSAEYFKKRFIPVLEGSSDIIYMDFSNVVFFPGASWVDEVFRKLNKVQKELVQQKLVVHVEYSFCVNIIENLLGKNLIKHHKFQKELELCKLKQKKSGLLNHIFRKIFRLK